MPAYEYQCLKCRKTFEVRRSWKERDAVTPCPYCQNRETERLYSPFFGLVGRRSTSPGGCGSSSSGFS